MSTLNSINFYESNKDDSFKCFNEQFLFKFLDCTYTINDLYKVFVYTFSIKDVILTYNIECFLYDETICFNARLSCNEYKDFINKFVSFEKTLYIEEIFTDIGYLVKLDNTYSVSEYFSLIIYGFLCSIFINNGVFYELNDIEWYKVFCCLEGFINNIFDYYRYDDRCVYDIPLFSISDKNYIFNYNIVDYKLDYNRGFFYNIVSEITYINNNFVLPLYVFLNKFCVLIFDDDLVYEYSLGGMVNNMCTNIVELNIRSYIVGYISNILLFEFKKYPSIVEKYIDKFDLYIKSSKDYYYKNYRYEYPIYELYLDYINSEYIESHLHRCSTDNIFENTSLFSTKYVDSVLKFYNYGKLKL